MTSTSNDELKIKELAKRFHISEEIAKAAYYDTDYVLATVSSTLTPDELRTLFIKYYILGKEI